MRNISRKEVGKKIAELLVYVAIILLVFSFRIAFINGYSMYPTYSDGEMNIINTFDKEPEIGKVMVYKGIDGRYVVHRVIRIEDNTIIFQGDNNVFEDLEVSREKIIGTLVFQKDKEELDGAQ